LKTVGKNVDRGRGYREISDYRKLRRRFCQEKSRTGARIKKIGAIEANSVKESGE